MLPKEDFNFGNIFDLSKEEQEPSFRDVFNKNYLPNISTLSISTRSNRSYDTFDIEECSFIDDFLSEKPLFRYMEEEISELPALATEIFSPVVK